MTARSFLLGPATTNARGVDAGLLVLRIGMFGLLGLAHGLGKIPPGEGLIGATEALGFPLPTLFAWAAALAEFAGGLMLAIGLLTRPAAFFVGFTMLVAFVGTHGAALSGENSGEMAFLYLVGAVVLGLAGAGRYSVDDMLNRRRSSY